MRGQKDHHLRLEHDTEVPETAIRLKVEEQWRVRAITEE